MRNLATPLVGHGPLVILCAHPAASQLLLLVDERKAAPGHNGTVNELMALSAARDWAARALAFARAAEPRTAPSRRSIEVDVALAATAAVASLITVLAIYTARGAVSMWLSPSGLVISSRPVAWHFTTGAVASVAVTTAPLALRRVYPLTAFWVVFLGTVLTSGYINTVTIIAVLLAAYSAVVHSQFRGAALISVLLAGLLATAMFSNTTPRCPAGSRPCSCSFPRPWWAMRYRCGDARPENRRPGCGMLRPSTRPLPCGRWWQSGRASPASCTTW